jgi:ubiquinone/menaquinone biosynthesis C-methylase UbiE
VLEQEITTRGRVNSEMPDPLTQTEAWNAVADGYDEVWFEVLPELLERAIAVLSPKPTMEVLDVGAGPGALAIELAPQVARVGAIDFADKMIEKLRARLARTAITNVETQVMDGQALAFPDASFDAVVSMFAWFAFSDRARGLTEFHRVLRNSGRVLVTSWAPPDRNLVMGAALSALREALPDLPRPSAPLPTQQPEVCAQEMRAAGFADVTATLVRGVLRYPSTDVYWDVMERQGAPMVALRNKLGVAWPGAVARVRAALRSRYGDGPLELDAEAIFTSGMRA